MQIVLISTTGAIRGDESPAPLSSHFQPTNESYLTLALAQPARWHSHQLVEDSITRALSVCLFALNRHSIQWRYRLPQLHPPLSHHPAIHPEWSSCLGWSKCWGYACSQCLPYSFGVLHGR
jgi:hypothetical protein